ncbi:MAG: pyroglutamyl-peptidase I [Planctomycetota bacterium]|nr:MAG: pyroglutamyl-peptidase I [Planctomycetota bacterium]
MALFRVHYLCRIFGVRILVTAFKPYDRWQDNSSWLALRGWLRNYDAVDELVTRLYPVELDGLQERLHQDLQCQPDAVLHLGQAPGSPQVAVETIAVNAAGLMREAGQALRPLVATGPVAYRTQCDVARMVDEIRRSGAPAVVSYHAGTFLCNALYYLSHHLMAHRAPPMPIAFVHLPLATEQVLACEEPGLASLPTDTLAGAIGAAVRVLRESSTATASSHALS